MNVLWDFRLFSYAYASRGVGTYTRACAKALLSRKGNNRLFIWGNRDCVPSDLYDDTCEWIAYDGGTWKSDLFAIPAVIHKHRIEVFHYWMALGPIHRIGMGLLHGRCRTIVTVYDLGVALWPGVPFLEHIRTTPYWRMQGFLLRRIHRAVCISRATATDLRKLFPRLGGRATVLYPPLEPVGRTARGQRESYFVTLGGSPNKNLDRVLQAFSLFHNARPQYLLRVLGEINGEEEIRTEVPDGVVFESMESYTQHLQRSSGLLFCSRNEGLGLPPLEAMSCGCPLLLSDIAPHRETADGAAYFAPPDSVAAICEGMEDLANNQIAWEKRALDGWEAYRDLAASSLADFDAYSAHEERLSQ